MSTDIGDIDCRVLLGFLRVEVGQCTSGGASEL